MGVLCSYVSVTLSAGETRTVSHELGSIPARIRPDRATPISVVSATASSVVLQNGDGNNSQTANFYVEDIHSILKDSTYSSFADYWKGNPGSESSSSQGTVTSSTDGRDGDADLDGINEVPWAVISGSTYTMNRVIEPRHLRVRPDIILATNGYGDISCMGDLTNDGVIHDDGADAVGAVGGVARAAGYFAVTGNGGNGGGAAANGAAPSSLPAACEGPIAGRFSGTAGGAGASTTGGTGATVAALSAQRGSTHSDNIDAFGVTLGALGASASLGGCGGNGGGGGAAASGGGGGAPGGKLVIRARRIFNNGRISANGGDGAPGTGAGAGGGTGGAGGRVRYSCVSFEGNLPEAFGGGGGAAGDATASPGHCGLLGEVARLNPPESELSTTYTLTAAERAAAIVDGAFDWSTSCTIGNDAGINTGVYSTSNGGSGVALLKAVTPDGEISVRINIGSTTFRIDLYARGVLVLSTSLLTSGGVGPTFSPYVRGDRLDIRAWYRPSGGARSMGIRFAVNHCVGYDTTGVASGAALASITSAESYGSGAAAAAYMASATSADLVGRIVILGDSISAPKKNSMGIDGVVMGSRLGGTNETAPIFSLAKAGGQIADQTSAWQASAMRGSDVVEAVVITLGHNDIGTGGLTAAQCETAMETLTADIRAQNPNADIFVCKNTPAYSAFSVANQPVWVAWQALIDTLTNVDAVVSSHQAVMGDANMSLRKRSDNNDITHPGYLGRCDHGSAVRTALLARGITP